MSHHLLVLKFGGHALATPSRIRLAARRIAAWRRLGRDVVAVASAIGGSTDRLLQVAASLCGPGESEVGRELDRLLCTGEDRASALLALALSARGIPSRSMRGGEAGLVAEGPHGAARLLEVRPQVLCDLLRKSAVPVVSGFQAVRLDGEAVTLGRGASDLTAVVLASALHADECHLIKNVPAIHDQDPVTSPAARPYAHLSHQELARLAAAGARVVHAGAARHAERRTVPIRVYSYRAPLHGTGTRIGEAA